MVFRRCLIISVCVKISENLFIHFTGMVHTQQDVQRVDLWHVRAPLTVDLGNLHVTHFPWWWTFLPCYIRILCWMVTFWTKHAIMDPHCDSKFTSLQAGSPSAWNHVFNALLLETDTVSVSPTFLQHYFLNSQFLCCCFFL